MPTWNTQQLKAITTKDKNILVSASAGSGKTTVLIARLIDLVINDRIPISSILAMTFTEAAASEMKKRLARELHKLLQTTSDEDERRYISRQLSDIQNAHISTIHSFCLSIVQEYYYTIGLDGERINHIMDTASMTLFQQQALNETIQKQYEKQDEAFLNLCIQYSARPENDSALYHMITSLASLASSKPNPEEWLTSCANMYQTYTHLDELPEVMLATFYDYLHTQIIIYQETLTKLNDRLLHMYPDENKKRATILNKMAYLPPCIEALNQRSYPTFKQAFIAICHGIVPTSPDKEDTTYNKLRKQSQQVEDTLLELLFDEQQFLQDIQDLRPSIHKLVELCMDYRQAYAKRKEEEQMIDFDDMEHFALNILQANDHAVAKKYQELFTEIMVDEFQDSNDVQNTLVNFISKQHNVFRVGDIKQSIYGFRHAKPKLMKDLIDHKHDEDEVIYLSNNYRSKKMIVDFNNLLFEHLMNIDGFDSTYRKEDNVETGVDEQLQDNCPIIFHAIDHNAINEQENTILSKNDFKASYIANKIIEIKDTEHRKWKDFVVLVRGNARKDDMKAAFDELHIPYYIDVKYGFYQSNAVQLVLSFLKFCLYPHDDINFLAIALSPLVKLTTQDIVHAKLQKDTKQSFYAYYKEHPTTTFDELLELKANVCHLSLSEVFHGIYQHQDYYATYTTMQEKTNLDLLFEKAVAFEETNIGTIAAFINQIEHIKDAQTAEAIPIGSEEDVVRVMSIHQSKGLQFPVVFLWSSSSQMAIEQKDLCICDSDLGIAMKQVELPNRYVRTTPFRIAMEHKRNKEELEEEMRILYVATTRAQQQMHIVDCIKNMEDFMSFCTMPAIYARNGYTSWILQSLYERNQSLFEIQRIMTMWQTQPQSTIEASHKEIKHYQQDVQPVAFVSASGAKQASELPSLSLQKNTAMNHGTLMHQCIENIPYPYSQESIISYMQQQDIVINSYDIQSLQNLAQDTLYQHTQTLQHYHELPYMVQDEQTILHGYLDYVAFDEHDLYIIDFKTDHLPDDNSFLQLYEGQLKTYEKAMHMLYPTHTIHTYIYSFALHHMISV